MTTAAEQLIPVILELATKNPMIVFSDTHFGRAVDGAVYGAFADSGQSPVSVGRLYVQKPLYEGFVTALAGRSLQVTTGADFSSDIGPVISRAKAEIIEENLRDAIRKGARLLTPAGRNGLFYRPLVLVNVDHSMKIMKEETFGPVLPVMPFKTEEEAVELANDNAYGPAASVWTRDLGRARRVALRLNAESCSVNDVMKTSPSPGLPSGELKKSGIGRCRGLEGLYAFSIESSVTINRGTARRESNWFPYNKKLYDSITRSISKRFGEKSLFARLGARRQPVKAAK